MASGLSDRDGVAVPVVRHLAKHIFEPLLGLQATGVMDFDGVKEAA